MAMFAVALGLHKQDAGTISYSLSLHVHDCASSDEAIGIAVREAMKMKPGFSVWETLIHDLSKEPK